MTSSLQKRSNGQLPSQPSDAHSVKNRHDIGLPVRVPKGTITGLRSFIRYANKSRPDQETEMSNYSNLNSIDETRHSYVAGRGSNNQLLDYGALRRGDESTSTRPIA